eukprot:scaffold315342_cov27-Tisochrysis_lutea.AAC.3
MRMRSYLPLMLVPRSRTSLASQNNKRVSHERVVKETLKNRNPLMSCMANKNIVIKRCHQRRMKVKMSFNVVLVRAPFVDVLSEFESPRWSEGTGCLCPCSTRRSVVDRLRSVSILPLDLGAEREHGGLPRIGVRLR